MCACVRACMRMCVCACVRAYVCVAHTHTQIHTYTRTHAHTHTHTHTHTRNYIHTYTHDMCRVLQLPINALSACVTHAHNRRERRELQIRIRTHTICATYFTMYICMRNVFSIECVFSRMCFHTHTYDMCNVSHYVYMHAECVLYRMCFL